MFFFQTGEKWHWLTSLRTQAKSAGMSAVHTPSTAHKWHPYCTFKFSPTVPPSPRLSPAAVQCDVMRPATEAATRSTQRHAHEVDLLVHTSSLHPGTDAPSAHCKTFPVSGTATDVQQSYKTAQSKCKTTVDSKCSTVILFCTFKTMEIRILQILSMCKVSYTYF